MSNIQNINFSQVKVDEITKTLLENLFKKFKIEKFLSKAGIVKARGIQISLMLCIMFYISFKSKKSIHAGLTELELSKHKNAYHRLLNEPYYDWRNFMLSTAKHYTEQHSADESEECCLIVDDTKKKKSGNRVENISWFYDHSEGSYFMGYQATFLAWYNGRTCIFLDFSLKTGKKRCKDSKKAIYPKKSHIAKRVTESRLKKSELAIMMIRRAIKRNIKFDYILWDSWYNSSDSFKFVYDVLLPKGKHLISMVKKNDEKYYYKGKEMTIKQICKSIKKWKENEKGIKYKSATVGIINKSSKEREVMGEVKMCFYSFPSTKRKNFKTIISTNIELTEEGVLEKYTNRWPIEVAIKDLKQCMGFDHSMSSTYASQIADLTLRCVFYNMLCSEKDRNPRKSIHQLTIQFSNKLEDQCIGEYIKCILKHAVKQILAYAKSLGYSDIDDLICVTEKIIDDFWLFEFYEEKIVEVGDKWKNQPKKSA